MESFYGINAATGIGKGSLGMFPFVMILSILNGMPFGLEYLISDGAITGYVLLFGLSLSIFFTLPFTLILSELSAIIPSNHGCVGYVYRGFHLLSPKVGDFVGFMNAMNVLFSFCIRLGLTPILFSQYLANYIQLSQWQSYLVMLAIIISGIIICALNIKLISYGMTALIIISIIPIFIGLFLIFPHLNVSDSLIGTCSNDLNISSFIVSFVPFFGFGFILIGNVMGEISFKYNKLPFVFLASIILSQFIYFIPFIVTSTFYPSCDDWEIGLFGIAYGRLWKGLYFWIEIGSLLCSYVDYIISVILCSRLIWSISSKHLIINKLTGTLIAHSSDYRAIAQQYLADNEDEYDTEEEEVEEDENYRIRIHILPTFINQKWQRTDSPIWAILIQAIISVIVCLISTNYKIWTEFISFMYLFSFLLIICSFLLIKQFEKNMIRHYEVPCGQIGAWTVSIMCILCIVIIGLFLVKEEWDMFIVAIALNVAFVCYYIIWKMFGCCCNKMNAIIKSQKWKKMRKQVEYDRLQVEREDIEESLSHTIPLL